MDVITQLLAARQDPLDAVFMTQTTPEATRIVALPVAAAKLRSIAMMIDTALAAGKEG